MYAIRRTVGVMILAMVVGALAPAAALAQSSRTVYVDDTGAPNAARSGQCGRPNYSSVQAAVDDLSASRVIVCQGTYTGQISVTRSLTLEGRSGAVLQAPAVLSGVGAIVSFAGAQQSRFKGFTITRSSSTGDTLLIGVYVSNGARLTISGNHIRDIRGVALGSTQGTGIYVDGASADITDNIIERYGLEGILATSSGTFVQIDDNMIRGQQSPDLNNGMIGIDIREGAHGDVEDNTITGNKSRSAEESGRIGIVVDLTDSVSVRDNIVTDNDLGIVLGDEVGGTEVRSNVIRNNTSHGVLIIDASMNTVVENESDHNGGDGIRLIGHPSDPDATYNIIGTNKVHDNKGNGITLGIGALHNTVKENKALNNRGFDIEDVNGGPPANVYNDNTCRRSNPAGLCAN